MNISYPRVTGTTNSEKISHTIGIQAVTTGRNVGLSKTRICRSKTLDGISHRAFSGSIDNKYLMGHTTLLYHVADCDLKVGRRVATENDNRHTQIDVLKRGVVSILMPRENDVALAVAQIEPNGKNED